MNPTLNEQQSLLISVSSCESDLNILLDACENYMINKETATKIINEVRNAVKSWRTLATRLGIAKREMESFAQKFDNSVNSQ